MSDDTREALQPVEFPTPFAAGDAVPEDGIGLCLSGGGYRAMLFHAGALWRLNELTYLGKLNRISSVSGGSITAGQLGLQWSKLQWANGVATNFVERVIAPIRRLAGETIDAGSILGGVLLPGSVSDRIVKAYRKYLYGDATLQDLPGEGAPMFVINATNVQSGAIVRFSRPFMADYRVGMWRSPTLPVALAVAASSAFPPVLSPARVKLKEGLMQPSPGADLNRKPFTTELVLTDGGVYDNLGLETVWKRYKTVIVSDGGGQMAAEEEPKSDWARHGMRINGLIDNQVRALRKRQVVGSLQRKERSGVYWRMRGHIDDYSAPNKLPCPHDRTLALAQTPTRLAKMDSVLQERIINWGYAMCDAGMRTWVDVGKAPPSQFPYPTQAV